MIQHGPDFRPMQRSCKINVSNILKNRGMGLLSKSWELSLWLSGWAGLWSGGLWSIICTLIIKCFFMSVGGLFNLEPLYKNHVQEPVVQWALHCASHWRRADAGVRDLPSQGFIKWPWSQHKHVWYNAKDCVFYFSPSFPILHSPVFSSVQASGIMAGGSWTGHPWQPLPHACWLLTEINCSASISSNKVFGLESTWDVALRHFPTSSNLQRHPKLTHGLPPW